MSFTFNECSDLPLTRNQEHKIIRTIGAIRDRGQGDGKAEVVMIIVVEVEVEVEAEAIAEEEVEVTIIIVIIPESINFSFLLK